MEHRRGGRVNKRAAAALLYIELFIRNCVIGHSKLFMSSASSGSRAPMLLYFELVLVGVFLASICWSLIACQIEIRPPPIKYSSYTLLWGGLGWVRGWYSVCKWDCYKRKVGLFGTEEPTNATRHPIDRVHWISLKVVTRRRFVCSVHSSSSWVPRNCLRWDLGWSLTKYQ